MELWRLVFALYVAAVTEKTQEASAEGKLQIKDRSESESYGFSNVNIYTDTDMKFMTSFSRPF